MMMRCTDCCQWPGVNAARDFTWRVPFTLKAGLDVRVIVDAFSNPWLQTQWMFFDLKQNGIEVEGYEAMEITVAAQAVQRSVQVDVMHAGQSNRIRRQIHRSRDTPASGCRALCSAGSACASAARPGHRPWCRCAR